MKSSKKALAFALAAAMAITGVPVTNAGAATTTAKLGATKATIYAGSSKYISVSTPSSWKSVKLSVSSSKTSVASVKKNNAKKKIRVDAVKAGTAKVTVKVTAKKSGKTVKKTLSANITVKDYKVRLVDAAGTTVSNTTIDTTVGTAVKLTAKTAPANDKVTFTSSDESVATVDASGNVTPVKAGTVTITAASAKATDKVTINVSEAAKEGVTATLTNPISTEYPNTVLVNNQAVINIKVVSGGKPAAGETVVFTTTGIQGATSDYEIKGNSSAVTNANGIASFVVGNKNTVKSNATGEVAGFSYTATIASTGEKVTGELGFAAISLSTVSNVNSYAVRPVGFNKLEPSTNAKRDGLSETTATATQNSNGVVTVGDSVEYVDSQQVSTAGGTEHQVGFDGGVPMITLPTTSSDISAAEKFVQEVNIESGKYHTYANDSQYVELKVNPNELTYATLNFSKLQLSEYTKVVIKTFKNKADAEADRGAVDTKEINGETTQNTFSYQIPLNTNYSGLCVKVTLQSAGQVDTDKNTGYTIKDITGVYKTQSTNNGTTVVLGGAQVTWKTVTAPMSEVQTLSADQKTAIRNYSRVDLTEYASATYQVPVFPYTGNAVITCYDANGNVKAYYVCPTINDADKNLDDALDSSANINTNVLNTTADCYKVSKEEAFNQVGAISQDGNRVIVNSEKVGVTSLEGTLTINGSKIEGLDATNSSVYTSVQWSPIPTVTAVDKDGFIGLVGQNISVVAQLTDKNDNPVSTAGEGITFNVDGTDVNVTSGAVKARSKVSVISRDAETDANGQAKLVLKAADVATLLNVTASSSKGKYKVVLKVGDTVTNKADLYWVEADLTFIDTVVGKPVPVQTSSVNPIVTTSGSANVEAKTGTNWEYGMKTIGTTLDGGVFDGKKVDISGLKINLSKSADSVGTINTATDVNGMATASSTKMGPSKIIGKLDSSSVTDNIVFNVQGIGEVKGVGTGSTSLAKKLTIEVKWVANGMNAEMCAANGDIVAVAEVPASTHTTVYTRVMDANGNPIKNATVHFAADENATVGTKDAQTDEKGIAKTLITASRIDANGGKTIVTATVDGISGTFTKTINWYKTTADYDFSLDTDMNLDETAYKSRVDGDKIILTFKDNVIASSVVANEFKVTYGGKTYEVSAATVDGNVVTLTVKNGPKEVEIDKPFEVEVKPATVKGVEYLMTSEQGVTVDTVKKIKVYTGMVKAPKQE